ncbi:hypothetical protein JIN84_20085 [Luteolibacter yonseiensis]|uniref:Uncharacterized protein n=1 Tax=Luteolibacter yonseiensis TaxID=1144680 RepID=A0A934R6K2_9BACT|nr:hypothetical protein [Luteolibacter yonseiensis]MBK1817932.1 hypothetical protein [Luteolibacter yonseiensis]
MKFHTIPIALLALSIPSCDKARSLAGRARSAVGSGGDKNTADDSGKVDPSLEKLVDRTAEGVVFRKDLPFPTRLDVKVTRTHEVVSRVFETSILGNTTTSLKGRQTTVTHLERAGDQVRYTLLESSFTEPVPEEQKKDKTKKPAVRQLVAPGAPLTYQRDGSKWTADGSGGFRGATLSKQLSPVFDLLLEENSLAPRKLWLGKKRIQIGTEIEVPKDLLPMLVTGNPEGKYTIRLDSIGAVHGHPCGVFTVHGSHKRQRVPDFEGNFTDEEVSVGSGRIWLSLLHPVILKEETDTVQDCRTGGNGSPVIRSQGTAKVSLTKDWKIPAK